MSVARRAQAFSPRDSVWNFCAIAVMAVCGLAANLLIAAAYGPAALGVFNQAFALYIVSSQLAAAGLHLCAQREAALLRVDRGSDNATVGALLGVLLASVFVTATIVTAIGFGAGFVIEPVFGSDELAHAWLLLLPGLWCFAVNKVLLGLVSGLRRFRLYAVGQAGRPLFFVLALALLIVAGGSGAHVTLALTVAEASLMLLLAAVLLIDARPRLAAGWRKEARRVLAFGLSAMPSMAFAELNTRVDVLALGLVAEDERVGVYSLVALLIEGALQLTVVVRALVNARLAQLIEAGDSVGLAVLFRTVGRRTCVATAALIIGICLLFPPFVEIGMRDSRYLDGFAALVALGAGVIVASRYLPFDQILVQAGFPAAHSRLKGLVLLANAALCAVFVPWLQITGAGVAYGLSFVVYVLLLRRAAMERVGVAL